MDASILTAEDVDRMVDNGEDMTALIRMGTLSQPGVNEVEDADLPCRVNPETTRPDHAVGRRGARA